MTIDGLTLATHWWWLIFAMLLAIAEIVVPGVFLIWLGLAALLTGFATLLLGLPLAAEFALFAVAAIASVYAGRRWFRLNPIESSDPLLNDRAARLIGQIVVVVEAIENGDGRVKVGDGVWSATGPDAPAGSRMRITGANGSTLTVEPA